MSTVSPQQWTPNEAITAANLNAPINQLAAVLNGGIDDSNVSAISGTKLSAGTTPGTAMATEANPYIRMSESLGDFIASGCVWSATSGLTGAMTAGIEYVAGKRIVVSAITSYTFTASKDTYVYLDNTGNPQYNPQANGAAQPATPAGNVLVAIVVTGASAITTVTVRGAGAVKASNIDLTTLLLGLVEQTASQIGITGTLTPLTSLSISFTLATAQTVSFLGVANVVLSAPPNSAVLVLKDGSTVLQTARTDVGNGLGHIITIAYSVPLAAGSHTITLNGQTDGGTMITVAPGSGYKTYLKVSLG